MKKRILIIEDNPMVVKSLEFKLTKDGYDVVVAEDGRKALEILKEDDAIELVITDLMLPYITGTELIEHIRNNTPTMPIIVLSTSNQEEIITDAFMMGVNDFITKPFSPNELSLRVKRTIESH
ncbi:response regulator transcription factor [Flagellimonas marinaquae]|uniref:Response regulator n=2 Tax=Flagellimonas TaxID=444459 RepID=A0A850N8C7_9FLAO|nr:MULTISPECIES: response regulator transcription factor [Allomuricauda]MAO17544.1 response regulator [Allomuricauda sp.]UBZ12299.1 response regulator transcription factor [Allomuricauda aquimarina]MBC70813.1 response regulator [Allomuricauda sp.]MBO0355495.1 response regulator transcription factor [Allomuricauda aurea]NVN16793.1 response regulator [Allomuricauda chongwuensis]|tara:strand:- start:3390 stop:3758 length:369 start_codon:yes stop_codon:yes gene_type:complete